MKSRLIPLPFFCAFVILALLMSGCLWGVVRHADTNEPISGATINWTDSNGNTGSTTSGAAGLYGFDIDDGPIPAAGRVTFEVTAPGREPLTVTRRVQYNDNASATIEDLSSFWEIQDFGLGLVGGDISTVVSGASFPVGVVYDSFGGIYFSDRASCQVKKLETSGITWLVAGTGVCGYSGDGGDAASAQLDGPTGLAFDASGDLLVVDSDNCAVRRVDLTTHTISTVAGNGTCGYSGDGGPATAALLSFSSAPAGGSPYVWSDVAVDRLGNIYISDTFNCRVRKVDIGGTITTYAGSGATGFACGAFAGDGGPATSARLAHPAGIAVTPEGDVIISDMANCRLRKVNRTSGRITSIAGDGDCDYAGDGGDATSASLSSPRGVAVDALGAVFISETRLTGGGAQYDCHLRRIDPGTGEITTVAGSANCGFSGDGGPATSAEISFAADISLSCDGEVAFTQPDNGRIRAVEGISSGGPAPDADGDGDGYICD